MDSSGLCQFKPPPPKAGSMMSVNREVLELSSLAKKGREYNDKDFDLVFH